MSEKAFLVSITFSHYCERARWSFDRTGVEFEEFFPTPGFAHALWKKVLPKHGTTVPVLLFLDEARKVQRGIGGSNHIMDWLSEQPGGEWLFALPEAKSISDWFDEELGWFSRALHVNFFLPAEGAAGQFVDLCDGHGFLKWVTKKGWGLAQHKVGDLNGSKGWQEAIPRVDKAYARANELLSDGRTYLAGDQFTAADVTFCALSIPIVHPPEITQYTIPFPPATPEVEAKVKGWRESPAGQYVIRTYASDRGGSRTLTPRTTAPKV